MWCIVMKKLSVLVLFASISLQAVVEHIEVIAADLYATNPCEHACQRRGKAYVSGINNADCMCTDVHPAGVSQHFAFMATPR